MLNIVLSMSQTVVWHPNPQDVNNQPVVPGVEDFIFDTGKLSLEYNVGGNPNNIKLTPLQPGPTSILIAGKNSTAPGEPTINETVNVNIIGPLDHFAPTADAPTP